MTIENSKTFAKEIMTSQRPFYYYLTIILLIGLVILFSTIMILRNFENEGLYSVSVMFTCFSAITYANFGQYLAKVSLYSHRLEVIYYFPWNKPIVFEFERIIKIDYRPLHFESFKGRWNVGGNSLTLQNENGKVCRFKYSINDSDDNKLIEELQKIGDKNIVCS